MDSSQAKEILRLYRPGTPDAHDPEFAEALRQVQRDDELKQWFEQHCAFQTQVREQLQNIRLPADLKARILEAEVVRRKWIRWQRPVILAAAAAIALLLGLIVFWWNPPERRDFAAYRDRMVRTVLRDYTLALVTENLGEINRYLAQHQGASDYVLPPGLQKARGHGCAVLHWQGRPVSMICFQEAGQRDLYLFITADTGIPGIPSGDTPAFEAVNKAQTATWKAGGNVYLLAAQRDLEALKKSF